MGDTGFKTGSSLLYDSALPTNLPTPNSQTA